MPANALPTTAAWQHHQARSGFEVVFFRALDKGYDVQGCTTAVEDGESWIVTYEIRLDAAWQTRRAHIFGQSASGTRTTKAETDGSGSWWVDGVAARHLDRCFDIDLESSAMTNAFPVHRMRLAVGDQADAPAVYVRALTLEVERLEQTYRRAPDEGFHQHYDYAAPAFDFACRLTYDEAGLLLDYPGIALRVR